MQFELRAVRPAQNSERTVCTQVVLYLFRKWFRLFVRPVGFERKAMAHQTQRTAGLTNTLGSASDSILIFRHLLSTHFVVIKAVCPKQDTILTLTSTYKPEICITVLFLTQREHILSP
jgi:hypothetical protein